MRTQHRAPAPHVIWYTCEACGERHATLSTDDRRYPCPTKSAVDNAPAHALLSHYKTIVTQHKEHRKLVTATDTELDLEELDEEARSSSTIVQRCVYVRTEKLTRRDGTQSAEPQLHIAWEPLSFEQRFDRAVYPLRTDDYTHDWLPIFSRAGKPLSGKMPYGRVKKAFNDLGFAFKPGPDGYERIAGQVFVTQRVMDSYVMKDSDGNPMLNDDGTERVRETYFTIPVELLTDYEPPAERRIITYPRQRANGARATAPAITEPQIAALKRALAGKTEDEYFDAVVATPEINCDPFLSELANGTLTDRLLALGGEVIKGRIYFS